MDIVKNQTCETDSFVREIMEFALNKSGLFYTENEDFMRDITGDAFDFFNAFYLRPEHVKYPNLRKYSEIIKNNEIVAVNNYPLNAFLASQKITSERRLHLFFHEIGHATGHENRLNRPRISKPNNCMKRDLTIEELTVEKSAQILMDHFGVSTSETKNKSKNYIEHYVFEIAPIEIEFVQAYTDVKAKQAARYILENWLNGFTKQKNKVG